MPIVIRALHYGKTKNGKYWLAVRPFHWKIDLKVLRQQHQKHYFKNAWLKWYHVVKVQDYPQNNAVFVIKILFNDNAKKIIQELSRTNDHSSIKPVLTFKSTKSKKYRKMDKMFKRMYSYMKHHYADKSKADNVLVRDKCNEYVFKSI